MMSNTINQYTASLDTELQALYGLRSRADDAADISKQVLNINRTISELAVQYLDPLQPIMDFKTAILAHQDGSNQPGAAGPSPAVSIAGNPMDEAGASTAALTDASRTGAAS